MYFYISNELGMCCWTYLISHCMFMQIIYVFINLNCVDY